MLNTINQIKKARQQELNDINNIQQMIKQSKTDQLKSLFYNNEEFNKTMKDIFNHNKRKMGA